MPGRRCKTVVALKTEWVLGFKHSVAKRKQKEKKKYQGLKTKLLFY